MSVLTATARYALLAAALLAATAAACGGSSGSDATPTPATPAATAARAAGDATVVFLRDNNLWIAPLDGSSEPRPITASIFGAAYAGYVWRQDGTVDLYFTRQLGEGVVESGSFVADFVLERTQLTPTEPVELLRFRGRPVEHPLWTNASVSPDGAYALYTDIEGLALLDVAAESSRRILTNSGPCGGPEGCFGYHQPHWAPDGRSAAIDKYFWEGGANLIVDPFASPAGVTQTPGGASFAARWSPDGAQLCVSEFTYSMTGAPLVYTVATGEFAEASAQLTLPAPAMPDELLVDARGCVWAADGRIAFGYVVTRNYEEGRIAVVDATFAVLAESEPVEHLGTVVAWLPDGSGVLFNRNAPLGEPAPPGLFDIVSGELRPLPFEADAVVAVIE